MIQRMSRILVNLEYLKLFHCKFDEAISTSLLSGCRKLMTLELKFSRYDDFPAKAFNGCPPVECLTLIYDGKVSNNEHESKVVQFLKNQNNLRKLTISFLNQRILDVIVDSCSKHLKSLHLSHSLIDMPMVPKLRILFSKLEELGPRVCNLDATITDLFTDCEILIKFGCLNVANIHKVFNANDFPQLEHLKLIDLPEDLHDPKKNICGRLGSV